MGSIKEVMSSASKYTTENLLVYSILLYTLSGDSRIIFFILGLIVNILLYLIIRNKDKNFPSLSMQTTMFFMCYIITTKMISGSSGSDDTNGTDGTGDDINPFFIFIIVALSYFIGTDPTTNFEGILVGAIIGICAGILYAYIISEYNVSDESKNVNLMGAPYSDYSKCETVEEKDLPVKIEKERQVNKNKCL